MISRGFSGKSPSTKSQCLFWAVFNREELFPLTLNLFGDENIVVPIVGDMRKAEVDVGIGLVGDRVSLDSTPQPQLPEGSPKVK